MATHSTDPPAFAGFEGFDEPGFTQVPDIILDHLLHLLSGAQLKVLLYIVRKTYGFRKQTDSISLSQLMHGITRRDGVVQDHGTGLTKKTLLEALSWLEAEGYIVRQRQDSPERGNEPTAYCLRMRGDGAAREKTTPPLGEKLHQGGGVKIPPSPWGKNSPTQETLEQETNISKQRARSGTSSTTGETSKFRKGSRPKMDEGSRGEALPQDTDPQAAGPGLSRIGAVLEARGLRLPHNTAAADHGTEPPDVTNAHLAELAQAAPAPNQPLPQGKGGRQRLVSVPAPSSAAALPTRRSAAAEQQLHGASTTPSSTVVSDDEREALARYLGDFAPELGDTAKFTSTLTWTCNTYARSGLTLSAFIQRLYSARSRTKEAKSASHIRGRPFPFFKALVEEECGLRQPPPEIAAAAKAQAEHQPTSTIDQPGQDRPSLAGRYAHMVHH